MAMNPDGIEAGRCQECDEGWTPEGRCLECLGSGMAPPAKSGFYLVKWCGVTTVAEVTVGGSVRLIGEVGAMNGSLSDIEWMCYVADLDDAADDHTGPW